MESGVNPFGLWMRKDWLDKLGMEVPSTVDEFTEVLMAFKDTFGCSSAYIVPNSGQAGESFASAYGVMGLNDFSNGSSHYYQIDHVIYESYIQDGYRDYLKLMAEYCSDGLITKDFASLTGTVFDPTAMNLLVTGEVGLTYSHPQFVAQYMSLGMDPGMEWVAVANPVLKEDDTLHFRFGYALDTKNSCISTACHDIENAVRYLDYKYTPEGIDFYCWGTEDVSYTKNEDGTHELTDLVINNPSGNLPSVELARYSMINTFGTGVYTAERSKYFYEPWQAAGEEIWASNDDGAYGVEKLDISDPNYVSAMADVDTYVREMILRFILGDNDIDTYWDTYVQNLKDIGIDDCTATYQEEYDEYRH